ncbi:MAG: hypothetical protein LBU53_00985, partial [Zoogloeaceae bacterium]|nr:hypothetical protein [Zoogloeaceae bacterium]
MLKNHAGFMKRALLTMLAGVFSSAAMPLDIYQGPMVAERSMDPNLLYIYDDSGSMAWDYMPDEAPSGGNNRRVAFLNKQYYNPDITYQPPVTYVSGRLVSWGNMDRRCVWPRVMNDGFTGTPNVCGATTTLTATTALYYDYIPGFNSRIDNQVDYTWEPIVMIDGKPYVGGRPIATGENALTTLNWAGAPENNANNYERYAFTTIPSGAKFRVGGTSTAGSSLVNATGTIVDNRACPVLFKDVVESRAYYNDYAKFPGQPGASDEFKGNPHAQCRYSYRTGDVDYQSNYQNYTSTAPYSGATVAGNIYGRVWCDRDGGSTNFTSLAQTRTCVMGKHVIGDTTGAGTLQTSANNNPVWDYTKYSSGVAPNSSTRKDHSLEHRVSKFVNDDGSLRTEPVPRVRTAGEEIRNFANWYSYYRTRSLAARSGTALAFANLVDSNDTTQPNVAMRGKVIRLGYDTINRITSTGPGQRSGAVTTVGRGVVPFIDNDPNYPGKRFVEDFYNWVKALPASGGTQLARALRYTGDYLENGNKKPWYEYPPDTYNGTPKGEVFGCRRSFAILMTDGYYTDTNSVGDADGTNGPVIWKTDKDNKNLTTDPKNSYQYRPEPPFFGQYAGYTVSNYLADVAMYFWKRDLQPGIPNLITPTKKDPAFWQHMQTFTIGLGVMGRMSDTEVNDFLSKGTKKNILWTFPSGLDTDYEHIDDLMHAGLNGHAGTSAAEDAGEFVGKLTQLLTEISGQDGSNTSPAVPRGLSNDSLAFEASYSPADWTGELVAKKICQPGVVDPDCSASDKKASAQKTKWGAQALLAERVAIKGHADRRIFTRDGSSAVTFDTGLPSSVKTAIDVDLNHSAGLPVMENCVMARPTLGNPPTGDVCTLRGSAAASVPYNVDHLINYLRGDSIYEDTTTGATVNYNGFRKRSYVNASGVKEMKLLGDIVNSSP